MNFERIYDKELRYEQNKHNISPITLSSYEKDFELKAERFAMSSGNGRSPRTAKQFVNQLLNEQKQEV